jgi:hypothetical protein
MEQWETEQQIQEILHNFYFENLKFCGCGNPYLTLEFIKMLLNAIQQKEDNYNKEDFDRNRHKYYEEHQRNLISIFEFKDNSTDDQYFSDIQDGIVQFVLYYLDEVGVIEHGSSIGGAWLTKYGKEILKALNKCENLEYVF